MAGADATPGRHVDAVLCDHVQPGGDGKLYVAGAGTSRFGIVTDATTFWVRIGVAATVTAAVGDEGPSELAIWAADGDGRTLPIRPPPGSTEPLAVIVGRVEVPPQPEPGRRRHHVIPACVMFEAEASGALAGTVIVALDRVIQRRLPFEVVVVVAPPSAPGPTSSEVA